MWLISWLVFYPLYIFCECHGLRGSIFIWHWFIKGELYVFAIIFYKLQFFFLILVLPFDGIQKGGEIFGKLFMVCHSKLYEYVIFIGFCLSSKRGRLLAFLKLTSSFLMHFDERQKGINQLTYSSCCYCLNVLCFWS